MYNIETPTGTPADRYEDRRSGRLRVTLFIVAFFQFALGILFLVSPGPAAELFGLPPAPNWTGWLFAMMAARFLGYGVGMLRAARYPESNLIWIDTMIAIQMVDWVATITYLSMGAVTLRNVATASFLPLLFAIALALFRPRRLRAVHRLGPPPGSRA